MFTRFRAAAFAALLLIISISPVMAHTYSPSHYAAPCSSGSNTYHPFFNVLRPIGFKADDHTTYGAYKSMKATATITDLDPCTSATSSDNGWDLINVVNGETMAYGANAYAFVQFGYAQQACVTGSCQDTFSPYGTDFWWTVADDNNGGVARADWIDFTGAGHSAGGRPVLGDRYQFTVNWIASPQQWQFCIKVISSSTSTVGTTKCNTITRHTYGTLNRVYWGAESYNDAGALGTSSGAGIDISPMQYMNANGSIDSTVTNGICNRTRLDGGTPWGSQQCSVTETGGVSHLAIYTTFHS